MNQNQLPTKSALKQKYGISNDDFQILTQSTTPSAEELKKAGHIIERVADWLGVPTYIIRLGTTLATVVAVLLVPAHVKTFQDDLNVASSFYGGMLKPFRGLPEPDTRFPDSSFSYANIASTSSSVVISTMLPPSGGV